MKLCMGCMKEIEDRLSTCPYCGFNETSLRQEAYYLDPGTVVGGRYIVGRVLQYGGHTVSYLGMDAGENRKVIVKEYLPSDFSTRSEGEKEVTIYSGDGQEQFEQGLTNFLNEANRIQHLEKTEGIAQVYDCVAENETGYVISEYVEGTTLKEILDNGKKYSVEEATAFVKQILQGLSRVHKMDIVHCDIAPETIMVTPEGKIKLMDFGATRYVTTANSRSLSIILKRGYAPEEQYRSKGIRGPWTDVYALGAVMYRMITGKTPQESVDRALSDDLKEPSKLGVSIPKNIEAALMNALNVYQRDRTPSAEAFLAELNSPEVKRIKVKQKKNKTGKMPLWVKGMAACFVLLAVAGGAYTVHRITGSRMKAPENKQIVMEDFRGKQKEELQAYIEKLHNDYELDFQLKMEETVFDLTKEEGSICSQSIAPGTVLYDPDKNDDPNKEASEEATEESMEGLTGDTEGRPSGLIECTSYTKEELYYEELQEPNAYVLAKKLGIDPKDEVHFREVSDDEKNYFDLASISIGEKTITAEDLQKANPKEKISYNDSIIIEYYASSFFYWEELPDFVKEYGTLDDIGELPVYKFKNEKDRVPIGKRSLSGSSLVNDQFAALAGSEYQEGSIIRQNAKAGEPYDETEHGGEPLLDVVGTILEYRGKTGEEFAEELKENGFSWQSYQTASYASGKGNWDIERVEVYPCDEKGEVVDGAEELSYFETGSSNNRDIFFVIIVKEPPAPEPAPAPTPSAPTPAPSTNTEKTHNYF